MNQDWVGASLPHRMYVTKKHWVPHCRERLDNVNKARFSQSTLGTAQIFQKEHHDTHLYFILTDRPQP